jgi:hypothetical protein
MKLLHAVPRKELVKTTRHCFGVGHHVLAAGITALVDAAI